MVEERNTVDIKSNVNLLSPFGSQRRQKPQQSDNHGSGQKSRNKVSFNPFFPPDMGPAQAWGPNPETKSLKIEIWSRFST